ncbi:MAG: ATP-binding protein [candidate division KSB1 bacterium]|nr:ATP-binding protein [candidate division KSB1 bacterium]
MNLLKYNRHWEKDYRYPYEKHRAIFGQLINQLNSRQIIEISGLRRTGKTTLLFQIVNHLMDQNHNPFSLWYFTFDEERPKLEELLDTFSKQTQLDIKNEKITIFLDEIQKLPEFQNQLKVYYDLYPNLKFFISGSTSLFIRKKSQESLAGRIKSLFLNPLSFEEYLLFTNSLHLLDNPLIFKAEIEKQFEIYLTNQFIESISFPDINSKKDYYIGIMKKIIFEDIPAIFAVNNVEVLWQMIRMIAQQPGIYIDYQNLANEIGLSNKTISAYLYYLEESFLIKKLYNFSRNRITSEKKLKRFYLASPSFSWALTDFLETGRLVENFVPSIKNYQFFWRDPYHHEVDFIELENNQILPIEIKYKETIQSKDINSLLLFSKKFNCKKAIIFKKGVEEKSAYSDSPGVEIIEKPVYKIA